MNASLTFHEVTELGNPDAMLNLGLCLVKSYSCEYKKRWKESVRALVAHDCAAQRERLWHCMGLQSRDKSMCVRDCA